MINDIGNHKYWLGLRLVNGANHGAHAARVVVYRKNAPPIWRRVRSDGSYASANDPCVVIGLGDDPTTTAVRVYWDGGRVEEWSEIVPDRYTILRVGTGKVLK